MRPFKFLSIIMLICGSLITLSSDEIPHFSLDYDLRPNHTPGLEADNDDPYSTGNYHNGILDNQENGPVKKRPLNFSNNFTTDIVPENTNAEDLKVANQKLVELLKSDDT